MNYGKAIFIKHKPLATHLNIWSWAVEILTSDVNSDGSVQNRRKTDYLFIYPNIQKV